MKDVTVCVPTMERPQSVAALVESVARWLPSSPILVADQGREFPAREAILDPGVRVDVLPHDCGVCAARNHLAREAGTPYVLMLDDDMVVHEASNLGALRRTLETTDVDLVSPALGRPGDSPFVFRGLLTIAGDVLVTHHGWNRGVVDGCEVVDFTFCVFMAKTDRLRLVPWDERLKTSELMEWYWRASKILRIAQSRAAIVEHRASYPTLYAGFRDRAATYSQLANQLIGVRTRRGIHHEGGR